MALLGYRPFGPGPSRSAFPFRHVRHPSVHSSLTTAVGNQHGSQGRVAGARGWCCAQQNAGTSRRESRNHPVGPESSPMPVRWDPPPGCRWDKAPGTSPRSTPTHFRAYRKSPTGWPHISPHHESALAQISGTPVIICPSCINIISPRIHRGRTCPAGIFPLRLGGQNIGPTAGMFADCWVFKRVRKIWHQPSETFSTGRFGLFGQLLGVALSLSVFPVITASY